MKWSEEEKHSLHLTWCDLMELNKRAATLPEGNTRLLIRNRVAQCLSAIGTYQDTDGDCEDDTTIDGYVAFDRAVSQRVFDDDPSRCDGAARVVGGTE